MVQSLRLFEAAKPASNGIVISRRRFMSRIGIGAACALTFPRAAAAGAQARGASENLFTKGTFFDIHGHLAQGWVSRAPLSVASLLKWMDARGIAQAAVLPLISPEGFDYPVTTEYVLTGTKPHRDRLVPFCDIDPRTGLNDQQTRDLLQKYKDAGARGLGEHKCGIPIDDPRNLDLFRACGEAGLPVLVHIDNLRNMDTPGLPGLAKARRLLPVSASSATRRVSGRTSAAMPRRSSVAVSLRAKASTTSQPTRRP